VLQRGHDVPDDDIRRRYERSLANLPLALRLAHEAIVYDNSYATPRMMLQTRDGVVVWHAEDEPAWAVRARAELLYDHGSLK
jgi:predicted ABC-type ATPase